MAKKETDNDLNDDGEVSDAEEAAAGPVDGDGDGKIDEDEEDSPRTAKARAKLKKSLIRHNKRSAAIERRVAEAEEERVSAGRDVDRITDEVGEAHRKRDQFAEGTPEYDAAHADFKAKQKDLSEAMITYDETARYERYVQAERRGRAEGLQAALVDLDEAVSAEAIEAEEKAGELRDKLDDDPDNAALQADAKRAERRLRKKNAKAERTGEIVNDASRAPKADSSGDEETAKAEAAAAALQTGPRGGRYYVSKSGERVYVK